MGITHLTAILLRVRSAGTRPPALKLGRPTALMAPSQRQMFCAPCRSLRICFQVPSAVKRTNTSGNREILCGVSRWWIFQ